MKVMIHPAYRRFEEFVRSLPRIFDSEGEEVYTGRNRIKCFRVNGVALNVKRYHEPGFLNRIVYTFFRPPKAIRAYRYAGRLLELGVNTPAPIACILIKRGGLLAESYFVSLQLPASYQTLYRVGQGPLEENRAIFEALGSYTAQLHQKGVYHKDYSPGNILYRQEGDKIRFVLIDINRMEFGPILWRKGCANFARIWGCEAAFRLMAGRYAEAMRYDKEDTVDLVLRYRERFWRRYARKHPIKFRM